MSELSTLGLARPNDAREIAEMSRDFVEQGLSWSWTPARVQHFIMGPDASVVVARRDRRGDRFGGTTAGDPRYGGTGRHGDGRRGDDPPRVTTAAASTHSPSCSSTTTSRI